VVDLGKESGVPPPLFWVKEEKKSQKEEKPAGQAKQSQPPSHPLSPLTSFAQGSGSASIIF